MRAQGSGRVVNITSIGGKITTPFGGWYHASKFAVEGLSDALRQELRPFGIDVVVIEPGAIRTEWSGIAVESGLSASGDGPYAERMRRAVGILSNGEARASDPDVVARAIEKAVTSRRPRTRYAIGSGAKPILAARRLLGDRAFDAAISRAIG
jgi:NAD(P)-dependent dehydrogenase (short-subunit alcohol dehydrogenase family)